MTGTMTLKPFACANDLLEQPQALREMLRDQGYLFFQGLAPRNKVLDLRRQMLELCRDAGWLDPGADLMDARWSGLGPYAENDPDYMVIYRKILRLEAFNAFSAQGFFMDLMGRVLNGPVLNHRMHIGRISFPNNLVQTTPPHQDFHYIRGTPETYTLWTP